jgi:glutaredoxin
VDHVPCLEAWQESLGGITYPLLSDFWPHGKVSEVYGVLRDEGHSDRAIFIIDSDGIIRYIDIHDIDTQPDNEELFNQLSLLSDGAVPEIKNAINEDETPEGDVVMYCNSWCPDCKKARLWFAENNIDYVEVDVNKYPSASKLVRSWADGNLVTPTFKIRGNIIVDFNKNELSKIFNIS